MDVKFKARGGSVRTMIERADREVVEGFVGVPASIVSDCLDRMNVIDPAIRRLHGKPFAGSAFTVEEIEAGNLMSHLALAAVQPGDVLVIDAKAVTTRACWGGLQTLSAKTKGVAAIIVDGAIRDADEVVEFDVPVYCRAVSPAGPHKGWGGRVNSPIACGGQVVNPGDVIVGDADGLAVVPRAMASRTLEAAREKLKLEEAWFERVRAGENTADFLGLRATAEKLGITFD